MTETLKAKIREASQASLQHRDLYDAQVSAELTGQLKAVQGQITKAILKYKSLGNLPDNKLAALSGLEKLQKEIEDSLRELKKYHTLAYRKSTKKAFLNGIKGGISELTNASMPFYKDLKPDGIDKLTAKVFTIVDTNALDFLTQYNLTLAGDVQRELSDGIKRTIMSGIATGKGAEDIVRDLGDVILNKDSFRPAGSKVFSKAQYRMEMITRTEVLRAHNMGRMKFHHRVGIQRLEWMAMDDERMCPVCGGLDGKTFAIDKFPQQPAHPHCRCTNIVALPFAVCGANLAAKAALNETQPDACILPPHVLEGMADAQAKEKAILQKAFEDGTPDSLKALTSKQLQTLAKANGVSVARTKADFIKLLDVAEPGFDHSDLAGKDLQQKLKAYKIGLLRTKDELASLLAEKQAQFQQAKILAAQKANIPDPKGLNGMSTQQLKAILKENGISQNITKDEAIDMLDQLEPGVNHSGLQGKDLVAAKQKHGIGILKNKDQMVQALQKKAGAEMADVAKNKALEQQKQTLIKKQVQSLETAMAKVNVPAKVADFEGFLDKTKEAETQLANSPDLPQDLVAAKSQELALKKKLFADQVTALKSSDLKEIAKNAKVQYWQWANKDELAALFTETDPSKIQAIKESIDSKHSQWAEKHGSKKAKPKATVIKPEPKLDPMPSPKTPAIPTKKGGEFDDADDKWKTDGAQKHFKHEGKANVGGAHEKEFWTDPNGDKWLFKPASKKSDDFIAHGEEAAYKIGRLIDPEAIEVRTITLNGRTGSIQKWRKDLKTDFDFRGVSPENLTTIELEQIQREHVLDWLIANHDGHSKQFIRSQNGKVYGIDKGQAFKFLGKDQLELNYHPNSIHGEEEPYYNKVFRAAKSGNVNFDPSVTLGYIQEVEKIPDQDYLEIIRPYAEGRFAGDKKGLQNFYDTALDRKHNLRKDFERYYGEVLGNKEFKFSQTITSTKKKILSEAEEQLVEEARKLGWQGKTLPFDSGDVEDQNALIFSEKYNGKERTVIKMKIRPDTDARIIKALQSQMKFSVADGPQPLDEDVFHSKILSAIKTASVHAKDGNYNQSTLSAARSLKTSLNKLAKSKDPDVKKMAKEYLGWLNEVEDAVANKRTTKGNFKQYLKDVKVNKDKQAEFNVTKGSVTQAKRKISKGEIEVLQDDAVNSVIFGNSGVNSGVQYDAKFSDGTKIKYRPWHGDNLYAQRGELEIIVDGKVSGKNVEDMLAKLDKLGVDAQVSSPAHTEKMYLEKMAYIRKVDHSSGYKNLQKSLDDRDASIDERVQALREYWQKELGVKDITKQAGYDPQGAYQAGFLDRKTKGGYRHQYRFDVTDDELDKKMKDYSLVHKLTNSEGMSGFIEMVMENNGAMVSTIEKMRMGVPPGGMSPVADMQSGGATYFFTRIKKNPSSNAEPALYFKKSMLRRMDAISYDHDAYGKVVDDYVTKKRNVSISDWVNCSKKSGNETIFKYSVTLLDNIDFIVAGSANERNQIVSSFTKRGITHLPDGRKIGDVVRTPSTWATR